MDRKRVYQALIDLGTIVHRSVVYRHVAPEYDCHSSEGARVLGGRWNPPDSSSTLYTAVTTATAAAELRRLAANQRRMVAELLPRHLCEIRIELDQVLDLRTDSALLTVGLSGHDIAGDAVNKTQEIGDAVYKFGLEGLLAPSSTGIGDILVVFPMNLAQGSKIETLSTTVWHDDSDLALSS